LDTEKNKESKKRFKEILTENGVANGNRIIVDNETGIHYLFSLSGYGFFILFNYRGALAKDY
jgi:hypothetical protein